MAELIGMMEHLILVTSSMIKPMEVEYLSIQMVVSSMANLRWVKHMAMVLLKANKGIPIPGTGYITNEREMVYNILQMGRLMKGNSTTHKDLAVELIPF
jgi:hypothetical protein